MNGLKHILVVVALLVVAMPHTHAMDHEPASDRSGAPASIAANHDCACHGCDDHAVCADELEMPQHLTAASATVPPALSIRLFVLSESKPVIRPAPAAAPGPLSELKTIRLLI